MSLELSGTFVDTIQPVHVLHGDGACVKVLGDLAGNTQNGSETTTGDNKNTCKL